VNSREKSLADMESDLIGIKEMRALQCFFVKHSKCTSWQDAQERYCVLIVSDINSCDMEIDQTLGKSYQSSTWLD
jgi:hypothetical protein